MTSEQLAVTLRECSITLPESIALVEKFRVNAVKSGMLKAVAKILDRIPDLEAANGPKPFDLAIHELRRRALEIRYAVETMKDL